MQQTTLRLVQQTTLRLAPSAVWCVIPPAALQLYTLGRWNLTLRAALPLHGFGVCLEGCFKGCSRGATLQHRGFPEPKVDAAVLWETCKGLICDKSSQCQVLCIGGQAAAALCLQEAIVR